jgi:hypothetical protein
VRIRRKLYPRKETAECPKTDHPLGRNDLLILLPSSSDSNNNFSKAPQLCSTRPYLGQDYLIIIHIFYFLPQILSLVKPKFMPIPQRWAEVLTLPHLMACPCCIISLLSLPFTITVSIFVVLG